MAEKKLPPLTDRQKQFVECYMANGQVSANDAAEEAGFSRHYGSELRSLPQVDAEIQRRRVELFKKYEMKAEEVVLRLCKQVAAPEVLAKYKKVDPETGKIFWDYRGASSEELALATVSGPEKDSFQAMTLLVKILGLAPDKKEISGPNGAPLEVNLSNEDLARRIAFVMAKVEN